MAEKKKKISSKGWVKTYKEYLLQHGELVKDMKTLLQFADRPFEEFKKYFDDLEELETTLIVDYFASSLNTLAKDDQFDSYSVKEQHLAFLYLLIENVGKDELFLSSFQKAKKGDLGYAHRLQKALNQLELGWTEIKGWRPDIVDKLQINPKKSVVINHAISCVLFFLRDKSAEKQDTDAYIEKSSDVLFRLGDTSTMNSIIDLGKFIFSRKQMAFG